jgi:hypothetical protein
MAVSSENLRKMQKLETRALARIEASIERGADLSGEVASIAGSSLGEA